MQSLASESESSVDFEREAFEKAYHAGGALTWQNDHHARSAHVVDYDPTKQSTLRLLGTWRGTVLSKPALFIEQALVVLLYVISWQVMKCVNLNSQGVSISVSEGADEFTGKMATLAAFLLGFYTSTTMSRWWRLRTAGVGNIWSASSQLSMFLAEFVTREEQVLQAIRRYARASLALQFLKRRYGPTQLPDRLYELTDFGILTADEVQKLAAFNNNLAEAIWTWVAHIVSDLYKKGDIKDTVMLTFLMEKVNTGRSGAAIIGAQMGTPIPMPYVHLLGALVKLHNIVLAFASGYVLEHKPEHWLFLTLRVIFVPLLYNAILLINAELADPFGGEVNDFSMKKYELGIEGDGLSYVQAGEHLPEWMQQKKA